MGGPRQIFRSYEVRPGQLDRMALDKDYSLRAAETCDLMTMLDHMADYNADVQDIIDKAAGPSRRNFDHPVFEAARNDLKQWVEELQPRLASCIRFRRPGT